MPYTTIERVNELLSFEDQVSAETFPSWAVVESWLPEYDAILEVALVAGGGTAPATGNTATWFGVLVQQKAAYRVMQVRGASQERLALWQEWNTEWDAAITALRDKEQAAVAVSAASGAPSSYTDFENTLTREKQY